jgi:predicted nucleic-acid-binding protein
MLAVDTNIVVRYLTADHPAQFAQAVAVVEKNDIFIGLTVLLETEWVLRSTYRYQSTQVVQALQSLAGIAGITIEEPDVARTALGWVERGMDFADALHLAKAQACDAFITFDQDLAASAVGLSTVPVQLP